MKDETVWLSQKQMAKLFDCTVDNISLHLKNIFKEGELKEISTTEDSSVVQIEGGRRVNRPVTLYNLDAIISVGYRINSLHGTQFRIWATQNKVKFTALYVKQEDYEKYTPKSFEELVKNFKK